jgi:hypothetical protein
MARARCLAAVAVHSATAPASGPGTVWPIGGFDRTTPEGKKRWDVLAALTGRVTKWRVQGSGTLNGTSGDTTFSGSFSFDIVLASTPNTGGAATAPEKQFAVPFTGYDGMAGDAAHVGSWTETNENPEVPEITGDYQVQVVGNWRMANSDPCAVVVGNIGYPMFTLIVDVAPSADSLVPIHTLSAATNSPGTPFGTCVVRIPDWMADTGSVEWTPAMAGPEVLDEGETRTLTIAVTMTPEECLPYGLDAADPTAFTSLNRIWNDDGTANENPLTAARV